jgi:UDP-N-acetylglucosamine 2-epimerase (non-hydrolysing)/GDP/UDP-N,N'-diacetylbacillosamine 2-epimerase (hydrolysing)
MIESSVQPHFKSLERNLYLILLRHVAVMVGNSSSGILEMPSFCKPTVNIGDRQKGRIYAESVFNCKPEAAAIRREIVRALNTDCSTASNPYGDGYASELIAAKLREFKPNIKKTFWEM